jgi:hypothetical protein
MSIFEGLRRSILDWLIPEENQDRARIDQLVKAREYRYGVQKPQLKVKASQADDNLTVNFTGLAVDRSISMLFGKGITFDLGGEENDERKDWLQSVWKVNKQSKLLHRLGLFGAEDGTCYVKIIPDGKTDPISDITYPRLVALDPFFVSMEGDADDYEHVIRYVIAYKTQAEGKEVKRRQTIEEVKGQEGTDWRIKDEKSDKGTENRWVVTGDQIWGYPFAPIVHWQNLPSVNALYGVADITGDVIDLQDRINFVASNISKIIRYHAHPKTWSRNFGDLTKTTWGADQMINSNSTDAEVKNLEMQTDLESSEKFMLVLRQALFDITRTVDLSSLADKLGALTNFGLRVLYLDALAKIDTKRMLYGDGLIEINHRLLTIGNFENTDGGVIAWPDTLPNNEQESSIALHQDIADGLVSKETASRLRGYDWQKEQEHMNSQEVNEGNVGALLLKAFNKGK